MPEDEIVGKATEALSFAKVEYVLIDAVRNQRLAETARRLTEADPSAVSSEGRALARRASNVCSRIKRQTRTAKNTVVDLVTRSGIEVASDGSAPRGAGTQFHQFHLRISRMDLDETIRLIESIGYTRWENWSGGAWKSFVRSHSQLTMIRTDSITMRLVLSWGDKQTSSLAARIFKPSAADYELVTLTDRFWPLYHIVRPVRLVGERLLGKSGREADWPFLGTPEELVIPLLDLAAVTSEDQLMDLGCGDGRIVETAAREYGCHATGVENDRKLAELAELRCSAADIRHLVEIVEEDGRMSRFDDVTVLFLFLPASEIGSLICRARSVLKSGARIVAHEQSRIKSAIEPDQTRLLLADAAVTVAHVWTIH